MANSSDLQQPLLSGWIDSRNDAYQFRRQSSLSQAEFDTRNRNQVFSNSNIFMRAVYSVLSRREIRWLSGFITVWVIPSCIICVSCAFVAFLTSVIVYAVVYYVVVPPRFRTYPVFFDYHFYEDLLPSKVSQPSFHQNCTVLKGRPNLGSPILDCSDKCQWEPVGPANLFPSPLLEKTERRSMGQCEPRCDATRPSESSVNNIVEETRSGFTSKSYSRLPVNRGSRLMRKEDAAVAHVDFANRTWELFPLNAPGILTEEAFAQTHNGESIDDAYENAFDQSLGDRLVVGYEVDFSLHFTYRSPHVFLNTKEYPSGLFDERRLIPAPIMFTIELFDKNRTQIARSSRPFVPLGMSSWLVETFRALWHLPGQIMLGRPIPSIPVKLHLLERFPNYNPNMLFMARIEMHPTLPIQSAELTVETQLKGIRWTIRENPVVCMLAFVVFGSVLLGSCSCICCFAIYYRMVNAFSIQTIDSTQLTSRHSGPVERSSGVRSRSSSL